MENKKYYSSKETRELLDTTTANLKYIEDALSLDILRDENNKRMYSQNDLDCFKQAIKLRKRGYVYKEIKEQLQKNEIKENTPVPEITIDKVDTDIEEVVRKVVKEELDIFKTELYKEFDTISKQNNYLIQHFDKFSDELNFTITTAIEEGKKGKGLFNGIFKK